MLIKLLLEILISPEMQSTKLSEFKQGWIKLYQSSFCEFPEVGSRGKYVIWGGIVKLLCIHLKFNHVMNLERNLHIWYRRAFVCKASKNISLLTIFEGNVPNQILHNI